MKFEIDKNYVACFQIDFDLLEYMYFKHKLPRDKIKDIKAVFYLNQHFVTVTFDFPKVSKYCFLIVDKLQKAGCQKFIYG